MRRGGLARQCENSSVSFVIGPILLSIAAMPGTRCGVVDRRQSPWPPEPIRWNRHGDSALRHSACIYVWYTCVRSQSPRSGPARSPGSSVPASHARGGSGGRPCPCGTKVARETPLCRHACAAGLSGRRLRRRAGPSPACMSGSPTSWRVPDLSMPRAIASSGVRVSAKVAEAESPVV